MTNIFTNLAVAITLSTAPVSVASETRPDGVIDDMWLEIVFEKTESSTFGMCQTRLAQVSELSSGVNGY